MFRSGAARLLGSRSCSITTNRLPLQRCSGFLPTTSRVSPSALMCSRRLFASAPGPPPPTTTTKVEGEAAEGKGEGEEEEDLPWLKELKRRTTPSPEHTRKVFAEAGLHLTNGEVLEIINRIDADGDGKVGRDDLEAWCQREDAKLAKERKAKHLRQFVENSSSPFAVTLLTCLDYFGTIIFSISSCMLAADCGMNLMGCVLVSSAAALGGGTVSNLVHGITPVFWIQEPNYLRLAVATSVLTFIVWQIFTNEATAPGPDSFIWQHVMPEHILVGGGGFSDTMFWCDTFGLAAFAVIGAQTGIKVGAHPFVCAAGGVMIVLGGVIRDVLCQREIALGGSDPYASSVLAGASVYTFARFKLGVPGWVRIFMGWGTVVGLRTAYFFEQPWLLSIMGWLSPNVPIPHPNVHVKLNEQGELVAHAAVFDDGLDPLIDNNPDQQYYDQQN